MPVSHSPNHPPPDVKVTSQLLPHKPPLCKAQPPLTRPLRTSLIHPRQQPLRQLLPHLPQILPQRLRFLPCCRSCEHLVEWEAWFAGDGEVGVEGDVLDFFLCFSLFVPMSAFIQNQNQSNLVP
jgi:hypothetical protein